MRWGSCIGDLKSANVLIAEGDGGPPRVKPADFGVSTFLGDRTTRRRGGRCREPAGAPPGTR